MTTLEATTAPKLLFVEDDPGLRRQLKWSFSEFPVVLAPDRPSALEIARKERPDVVVLDLGLPPDDQGASEGLALLEELRAFDPRLKLIVLTGNEDRSNAVRAISLGAFDFCGKPMDGELLKVIIGRAHHLQQLEAEAQRGRQVEDVQPLPGVVTGSPVMHEVCRLVQRVAPTDVTVVLIGESGTGKEVIARALHQLSPRRDKPFIAINCGAIPENLLESELFGHEKGSFTGAVKRNLGMLEVANHGTLLLDEIGDIVPSLQVKLLRFLQERVIERIGGRQLIPLDVRIVCATNRNLSELIKAGSFREDLYYRLNEFRINIPPLRDRPGDELVLAHYFMNQFATELGRPVKGFTPAARAAIAAYKWPGNVREMQNRLKRAVLLADRELIGVEDLELGRDGGPAPAEGGDGGDVPSRPLTLKEIRHNADRQALREVLAQANGNVSQAAKILGVSRPTLYDMMRQHNIKA